ARQAMPAARMHQVRRILTQRFRRIGPNWRRCINVRLALLDNIKQLAALPEYNSTRQPWVHGLFALAEEDVICGIGDAAKGASLIARALGGAAVGVDPLHGGDIRERPASA